MSSIRFDSLKEAQKYLEVTFLAVDPTEFCPLLVRTCVKNCVCMRRPRLEVANVDHLGGPPTKWTVYGWTCTNAMFIAE